jgi:hypothetical protein
MKVTDFKTRSTASEMVEAINESVAWQLQRTTDDQEPYLRVQLEPEGEWLEMIGPDPILSVMEEYRDFLTAVTNTCVDDKNITKKMPT